MKRVDVISSKLISSAGSCFFLVLLLSFSAYGQVIQTPDSEEQRRRAQVEAQERQRLMQQPRVELSEEGAQERVDTFTLPTETPCFPLHRVGLEVSSQLPDSMKAIGGSALPQDTFHFAHQYLQHYVGQCVGQEGVKTIVQRVSDLMMQQGYSTTRVGINQDQDLSSGEFIFTLVPGMIREIRFSDPSLYGSWRNAFPTGAGHVLNLRDIEQGLEQMKRVTSQDVSMQIVPAEQPGESDIVLTVQRHKNWRVSVSLDNSGAKGTGQWQAGTNLAVDNLLGLSDILNVGLNTDAGRDGNQRGTHGKNLYYSLPWGYWTSSLSASTYDYHQEVAGQTQTFLSSGKTKNLELKTTYLFQRDQTQKNSWQFNVGKRWQHSFINGSEVDVQKRNITYIETGWVHKHYWGNTQLDVSLLNRWGSSWLGGQSDINHLPADYPSFTYSLQTVDATLNVPFRIASQPMSYIGTLRGQTTQSSLYLSDQFSIGGRYTVRGFDGELTLTAERGFFLRNELDIPIASTTHSAYLGLDVGKVFGPSAQYLVGDTLAGATFGLRGFAYGFSYDLFSSWPVYRPQEFTTSIPSVGVNVSFQY